MNLEHSVHIQKENLEQYTKLTKIRGSLVIFACDVTLPELKEVNGRLTIYGKNVTLPALENVTDTVELVGDNSNLPALKAIACGLRITCRDANLPVLVSVGGSLIVDTSDSVIPKLQKVCGSLLVEADSLDLPALRHVRHQFNVAPRCKFDYSKIKFTKGVVLAIQQYVLFYRDGEYRAGCRGPWTAEQALAHWNENHKVPQRAMLFREAIVANEAKRKPRRKV